MLLATLAVLVVTQPARPEAREHRARVASRAGGRLGAVPPTYLEFAPASGAGLPVAEDLCDALAAEVPNWATPVDGGAGNWCLGGDGQEVAGSQVDFEPFGSPTPVSVTVCPSGPDCATKSAVQTSQNNGIAATGTIASGTGAMTACWLGQVQNGQQKVLLSASSAFSTGGISWLIEHIAGGTGRLYTSDGTTIRSLALGGPEYTGEHTVYCISHAGGSAVTNGYLNGTAGTASAAGTRQSLTVKPTVDGINGATYLAGGTNTLGAFYVDQALSAATIAAIARRVLADQPKALIRGNPSIALTYTRTGSMFCSKADNTGSILPANRPCISQNGILVEAAGTNLVPRSQEFDNAAWSDTLGSTTVTANHALSPDGTKTSERIVFPASSAARGQTITAADGTYTFSFYAKGTSGSGSISAYLESGGTLCSYTATEWTRCTRTTATSGGSFVVAVTNDPAADADDVLIWGAQVETGSVATSYTPTTSAAATRGLVTASISGLSLAPAPDMSGCMAATYDRPTFYDTSPLNLTSLVNAIGLLLYQQNATTFGVYRSAVIGTQTVALAATGNRGVVSWVAGDYTAKFNGTPSTGSGAAPASNFNILQIGDFNGSHPLGGRISTVQLDPRPSRCR